MSCQSPRAATTECVEDPSLTDNSARPWGETGPYYGRVPDHISPDPSASQEPSETLFGSGGQAGPWGGRDG